MDTGGCSRGQLPCSGSTQELGCTLQLACTTASIPTSPLQPVLTAGAGADALPGQDLVVGGERVKEVHAVLQAEEGKVQGGQNGSETQSSTCVSRRGHYGRLLMQGFHVLANLDS